MTIADFVGFRSMVLTVTSIALIARGHCCVAQGLSATEAASRMTVPEGLIVSAVASEPLIKQPVCIEFDHRGRLWVIQYLQYPNPEGLKRVAVDRYSRTKYDRLPDPPPHGIPGADRITILEDTNHDGVYDHGRDFVDGLNLATGMAFGHRGVFVLNVPYLLFYPDNNGDDVPDQDPEALLTGFGMEDAHSVANSLTWGPDGWLYGCQGSTVTANIRGIEFQQGVWRYHPVTKAFELFCEGGGNSWGLDFDATGRLFYSTNYGGHVLLHGVQGAYYVKAFAKHGALHNPHAYGYFDHAPHTNFQGGHVTVGGIIYQEDTFPESFRGRYVAGDLLGHAVRVHQVKSLGSTVATSDDRALLTANDTWFAPTDVTTGPDGAIYVADWHDVRTAHPDPDADWDRTNGRIYRIAPPGAQVPAVENISQLSNDDLVRRLQHRSQWHVRRARMELISRRATAAIRDLQSRLLEETNEIQALEYLWTLCCLETLDEPLARQLLESPHPSVRQWTLRFLGDRAVLSDDMAHRLDELAETEPSIAVRQQIACTAARLPAHQALPMINANINRDIDGTDPYLPLLWWWAVERHSVTGREEVLKRFVRPTLWKSRLGSDVLLPRLVRRWAAEQTVDGDRCVLQILNAAPDATSMAGLWKPILDGRNDAATIKPLATRHLADELRDRIRFEWKKDPDNPALIELAIGAGEAEAVTHSLDAACNFTLQADQRIQHLGYLRHAVTPEIVERLLPVLEQDPSDSVLISTIQIIGRIEDKSIGDRLIQRHGHTNSEAVKTHIRATLLSRPSYAAMWLNEVETGVISASVTPLEQIRQVALLEDPELNRIVQKHWGKVDGGSREEKLAEVRRLNNDLRAASGDLEAGRLLFRKHCAACHQLFGEGTKLGPDLTTANRMDREFLLVSLVDPASVIRREYMSFIVLTRDGRTQSGLATAQSPSGITLVNAKNERTEIAASEIEELKESSASLMPEDLYRQFKPQELRDLFAWLQAVQP